MPAAARLVAPVAALLLVAALAGQDQSVDLLLRACPPNEFGEKSITVLAIKLGLSAWAVHKWANRGKLPPNRARDIVDIADPRAAVTLADFTPFVYA